MKHVKGIKQLENLMRKLQVRQGVIDQMDDTEVDLEHTSSFTPGPYLHQDVRDPQGDIIMSEEESAKFEQDNPEVFRFLRDIKSRIDRSMEG